jgi:hypothetical protein
MHFTGGRWTGCLLGVWLFGSEDAAIIMRVDIAATSIFHEMIADGLSDLDLSCTRSSAAAGTLFKAGAQAWTRKADTS